VSSERTSRSFVLFKAHVTQHTDVHLSSSGPYYTDIPYDTASQRSGAGLYRENDGLERSPKYRSARRTNPPLYVDFETNTTISDRRYRGYQEEDHAANDWESGTSQNTRQWGNNLHAY
jgi:hypothetical protein